MSGKSTVADRVVDAVPGAGYVYLGTNPSMRPLLLPTTPWLRSDEVASSPPPRNAVSEATRRPTSVAVAWLRTLVWLSEQVARGIEARWLERDAGVVVRDRDFLLDRIAGPVPTAAHERFHRWVLRRLYPEQTS